jgi:hypothetical protein
MSLVEPDGPAKVPSLATREVVPGYNGAGADRCAPPVTTPRTVGNARPVESVIPRPVHTEPVIHHDPGCGFLGMNCVGHFLGGAAHAVGDVTGITNAVNCIENPTGASAWKPPANCS